jgi:hypothetical protein
MDMRDSESPPLALISVVCTLLILQVINSLTAAACCWKYMAYTRELRTLQTQTAFINNNRSLMNAFASDALEYSKKNPSIDPILESVGLKTTKSAPAAGAKTTAK